MDPKQIKIDGAQLKAWRDGMGYSQRDVCLTLGCSPQTWTGWETGRHPVPRYIGYAIAALNAGLTVYGDEKTIIDQKIS